MAMVLVGAVALPLGQASAQTSEDALQALRTGEYQEAVSSFRRLARSEDGTPSDYRGWVRALSALGRYEEAEEAARTGVARLGSELQGTLGAVLLERGKVDAALSAFTRAVEANAGDAATARLKRAMILHRTGRRDQADREFDSFIDFYNQGGAGSSEDLVAVADAVRFLGARDPDLFQDALRAYDEAVAADPWNMEARILTGTLFLEKYDGGEAAASFRSVLEVNPNHPDALVGYARTLRFNGEPGVRPTLDQALQLNPNHVQGRVFLASLHLSAERHADARREAERALEVNPTSLEALSVLAAGHYLSDDLESFEGVRSRVQMLSPGYADLLNTVADLAVDQRRYADAVALAREAAALDPRSWRAFGIMGINLLRLGQVEESRSALERAFEGDPYNVWYKNTLDLLDTYDRYVSVETEHFEFFLRNDEADLLAPYATALAEEAYGRLVERYGYEPPNPVRMEIYPSHADFSVRTAGLAGIGILGVSFGSVLAMDSPSARGIGEFNWGSTLWHELAHAFHLGMTQHRVPRWFSEGLAVREQRLARPGWGHQPDVGFLLAYDAGRLQPVSSLNEGFVRPAYPEQVVFSYYQASLVFDMLEEQHGFPAVLAMLEGYGDGGSTEALVKRVLGLEMDELDERFDAYMRDRFGASLEAVQPRDLGPRPDRTSLEAHLARDPDDFTARFAMGRVLLADGDPAQAIPHLEAARELFPELGALDGPDWFLAQAHEEREDAWAAAEAYGNAVLRNESHYAAGLARAGLLEELGEHGDAARALERAILIYPYEIELHEQLADLFGRTEQWTAAVRERRAVLALNPADEAEARYRLAVALLRAGDSTSARSEVLRALELAPSYEDALELLLDIRERAGSHGEAGP
jgi:tetratricopeptide (TPR) repeat protein